METFKSLQMGKTPPGTPATINLIAVAAVSGSAHRLSSAFRERRAEIVDELLSDERHRVSIVAVVYPGSGAEIFISRNQTEPLNPCLSDVESALQDLLRCGRFGEGVALVLGRRKLNPDPHSSDYPELLRTLAIDGCGQGSHCERGLAGLGEDARSLTSTLLWWELARAGQERPGLNTLKALGRAQKGFSAAGAFWQAKLAGSARQAAQRAMQMGLFEDPPMLQIGSVRFEVIPAMLASCEATSAEPWAASTGVAGLSWRRVGWVKLHLSNLEPDYGDTPLTISSLRVHQVSKEVVEFEIAADFLVRTALGLKTPAAGDRLLYWTPGVAEPPGKTMVSAPAGQPIVFRCAVNAKGSGRVLTCASTTGQLLETDIFDRAGLHWNGQAGDCNALAAETEAA